MRASKMNVTNWFVTNTAKVLLNRLVTEYTNLQYTLSLIQDRRFFEAQVNFPTK